MKSDVIHIASDGTGIAEALRQTEAVAVYKSLARKDSVHLMILADEVKVCINGSNVEMVIEKRM